MTRNRTLVGLLVCALAAGGCASSGGGIIDADPRVCAVVGGLLVGAAGAHAAAETSHGNDTGEAVAAGAGGAVVGAAIGSVLCARAEPNASPTARASATPTEGEAPLAVELRAVGNDPDGQVVSYAWDLGDGSSATGSTVRHTYQTPGTYTARVTVTDDQGATGSGSARVRVREVAAEEPPPVPKRRIVLRGVNFDFDSDAIRDDAIVILMTAAEVLNENSDVRVEVAGHTDSTGPEQYNQGLSERRARAVVNYLVGQGIPASRLRPVGYGESRPVADNGTRDGRAQNRRVELTPLE